MGFAFNPFTGTFDVKGAGGGGGSAFFAGEVPTYADLPLDGTAALDSRWLVRSNSGTWPFSSYKQAGVYVRIATVGSSRDNDYRLTDTSFFDVMSDAAFLIYDDGDATRNLKFQLSGISTGTTRTLTAPNASGTMALAADVFDFDFASTTSSATGGSGVWTWTIPSHAKLLRFWVVGAGGGGGSGRRGAAASNRTGGAGGHAGGITDVWYSAASLNSPLTVTIGAGGAGGAAQTADNTNGNNGTNGGLTSVSDGTRTIEVIAPSGSVMRGGIDGTATAAAGGNTSVDIMYQSDTGATGTNAAGTGRQIGAGFNGIFTQGGSGGGGINTGNVAGGGGFNFSGTVTRLFGTTHGGGGGANTGGNGGNASANGAIVGGSGSGGGANLTGAGGNGGNGYRGGGGGGGGASVNGNNSGAGGNGGNGFVRISVFY